MDWAKKINTFFKVKSAYGDVGTVKKLSDYSKKISKKKKLTWDDVNFFGDPVMNKIKKNVAADITKAEAVLATKIVWPARITDRAFEKMLKLSDKHGHDSKQAQAAFDDYLVSLRKYHNAIIPVITVMEDAKKKFGPRIEAAENLEAYARILNKAFMACTKIPSPFGTGQNSEFFGLSQDALHLAGQYQTLASLFKKIKEKNAKAYAEGNEMANTNGLWIGWALELRKKKTADLAKNRRAKTPKK